MPSQGYVPVFQRTRGGIPESVHFGAAAVVDSHGRLLASVGDPHTLTFLRSSAKPFQALPFVENGGPDHFGFSLKETALTCASHSGTDDHAATAVRIQEKAGFGEGSLQCGVHMPTDAETRKRMEAAGQASTSNRHNCSGKHSGMLAFAKMMGWDMDRYLETSHPLQQRILQSLAEMADLEPAQITIGTDGCSAPNFALPLFNAALAYARLVDPTGLAEPRAAACRKITAAMGTHPDMVAGPGKFDTRLMEVGGGLLITKGGAEEYQGIGLFRGSAGENSSGIGIAMKISDGAQRTKARPAVALEILRQLGVHLAWEELSDFGPQFSLTNYRKIEVGTASPCFTLVHH